MFLSTGPQRPHPSHGSALADACCQRFEQSLHPLHSPIQWQAAANGMCRSGGKLCVRCRVVKGCALTGGTRALSVRSEACEALAACTPFATWAAEECLARVAVVREREAGEAHRKRAGNERESRGRRLKCKTLWGPSGRNKDWRCEPLSFAYFSLRRCTDWRHR